MIAPVQIVKTVTMVEFRRNAAGILRRLAKGERFILSHRGRPAARLEPLTASPPDAGDEPFLTIGRRATPSPKGRISHDQMGRSCMAATEVFVDMAGLLSPDSSHSA